MDTPSAPGTAGPDASAPTLLGLARGHVGSFAAAALLMGSYQLAMNRIDWLSKDAVDRILGPVSASGRRDGAMWLCVAIVVVGTVANLLRVFGRRSMHVVACDIEYGLRRTLLHKLHRLGTSFYRRFAPGEIMSRATTDLTHVRTMFVMGGLTTMNLVFASVSSLQVMLHVSTRLTLAALTVLPVMIVVAFIFSRRYMPLTGTKQTELGRLSALAQRHFASIRVVRSFAIESFEQQRFGEAAKRFLDVNLAAALTSGVMMPLLFALHTVGLLVIAWYGAALLRSGGSDGISRGDFFAFISAWVRLAWPLAVAASTTEVVQRGRACFARLREIIAQAPDVPEVNAPEMSQPTAASSGLRVAHLGYATGGRTILADVSFELPAGQSLAIIGHTGAGKSTLAALLVRLLPTARGTVFFDGRDVCDLDRKTLRGRVGYAQQDPFLFSSSIAENLGLARADRPPSDEEIRQALSDAQILTEVGQLPEGAQTIVGERGVQLSGGQRQRVALARALLSPAPLLVLDDPLSAVDAHTEAGILDALERRSAGRSTILITHRIATAARCSRVLVLAEGRVVQAGTHEALMAEAGIYARLAEEQSVERDLESLAERPVEAPVPTAVATPARDVAASASQQAQPSPNDLRLLARLWPFLRAQRVALVTAAVFMAVLVVLTLLRPLAMGQIANAALAGQSLLGPGLLLATVIIGGGVLSFVQNYLVQRAGAHAMVDLRMHLFRFTDRLGLRTFDRTPIGRLVTRVINDVEAVGEIFTQKLLNALGETTSLVAIAATMLALDWRLALIVLAGVPLTGLLSLAVSRIARDAYRAIRTHTALLNGMLNEQVTGIAVVQALGLEGVMAERFDAVNRECRAATVRVMVADAALDSGIDVVQTVCIAGILLWAGHVSVTGGALTLGLVVTFSQYARAFFDPLSTIGQRFSTVQSAVASTERVFQFLDQTEVEPQSDTGAAPTATGDEAFAFSSVGFSYREGRPVLRDFSASVRPGERIAVVGPTGAGKSTLAQLLLRLYDVDGGEVRVLGTDVRRWPRQTLRRAFSVVPQEVMLFSGSLLDNIALGDPTPDRERALAVLDRLGLRERFLQRAGGLDARVDERALNFSVGERQLLSFARALYQDAPILLLDEATASIDSTTESQIQAALTQLMVGRTSLVIAHRLSTIESSDRILVLRGGAIVESGSHGELVAQGGLYARLHALQVRKARVLS